MLAYSVIIVKNQTVNKIGTERANMSRVTNEGVMICFKAIMANFLTVVGLLVGPITSILKLKGYLEASLSIWQHPIPVDLFQPCVRIFHHIVTRFCLLF